MARAKKSPSPSVEEVREHEDVSVNRTFSTIGEMIDYIYTLQQEYLAKKHEADAVGKRISALEDELIETFAKSDIQGAKGKLANVSVSTSVVPSVTDWGAVYTYVMDNAAWDLMYRRLNEKAYRDRLEEGQEIPGVEKFNRIKLSIRKIGE